MEPSATENPMQRYIRRVQLGMRLLTHGARPQTICQWTDLTPDKLIRLRRKWGFEGDDVLRGPSPHSIDQFFKSWTRRHQAALFLSICQMLGVIPLRRGPGAVALLYSMDRCERLCEAFEIFREWEPRADFDFDRIEFLLTGLVEGRAIELGQCPECSSVLLIDKGDTKKNGCLPCRRAKARRRVRKKKPGSLPQEQPDQAVVEKVGDAKT
jgi:Flagellar transcriptional activator (FlhC)